jgi:hypothetical protein
MMSIKKSSRFIALLLVALMFNVYSMKRLGEEEKRSIPVGSRILLPTGRWVEIVGEILLDEAHIQDLAHFTDLSPEILAHIIYLLKETETAQSLEDIAKNIRSLAVVNKELNVLINHPSFCLDLIKHFSQKFHCSDEEVARALQTQEAKRRLALQKELYEICVRDIEPNIQGLEECLSKGADINFTYSDDYGEPGEVLLERIYLERTKYKSDFIQWLIQHGANQNQQNLLLILMVTLCHGGSRIKDGDLEIFKILFNANADPEITDNGKSMLSLMQECLDHLKQRRNPGYPYYSQDINNATIIMKILEDAIKRKHGKK